MRMDRRRFLTGSIATASALTLAPTRARAQGKPIRIGYALSATGPYSVGAGIASPELRPLGRSGERQGRAHGEGRGTARRGVRHDRRSQRDRDSRPLLREAHDRRQGGPDPAALGDGDELRRRARREQERLSDDRPHGQLEQAEGAVPAVLLRDPATAGLDHVRAGRDAQSGPESGESLEEKTEIRYRDALYSTVPSVTSTSSPPGRAIRSGSRW